MNLTKAEVEHLAKLARLDLTETEKEEYIRHLNNFFYFVEKLNQANTTGVEPMAHAVPVHNVLRTDIIETSLNPNQVLVNAPDQLDNFFKVPKILEG